LGEAWLRYGAGARSRAGASDPHAVGGADGCGAILSTCSVWTLKLPLLLSVTGAENCAPFVVVPLNGYTLIYLQ